ncbi:MAG TPA: hypothetical protein VG122_12355 [Gemmata sp.]|nr:hypothetical protein [Gemmata sp.]
MSAPGAGFAASGVGDSLVADSVFPTDSGLSGVFNGMVVAGFGAVASFAAVSGAMDSVISDL